MTRTTRRTLHSVRSAWRWLLLIAVGAALIVLRQNHPAVLTYPDIWTVPLADRVNLAADGFIDWARGYFRAIATGLASMFSVVQDILTGLPWLSVAAIFTAIAFQGGGVRLALLTALGLLYILLSDY